MSKNLQANILGYEVNTVVNCFCVSPASFSTWTAGASLPAVDTWKRYGYLLAMAATPFGVTPRALTYSIKGRMDA